MPLTEEWKTAAQSRLAASPKLEVSEDKDLRQWTVEAELHGPLLFIILVLYMNRTNVDSGPCQNILCALFILTVSFKKKHRL